MPIRRFTPVVATALTVTAALGGCGSQTPSDQVRSVVQRFGVASAKHDYQEICDHLIDAVLTNKLQTIGLPCELALKKGLGEVRDPRVTIGAIRIIGPAAYVAVHSTAANQNPSDDTLKLTRTSAGWRIAALSASIPAPVPRPSLPAAGALAPGVPPGAIPVP